MKSLKQIRVLIALVALIESVIWVVAGHAAPAHSSVVRGLQISPAMASAGVGATVGAAIFWLVATFLLGRVYCSTICPVGTLQDAAIRMRRIFPSGRKKRFSYRKTNSRRFIMLGIYIISFVVAIGCVPLLLEPWPAFVNAVSHIACGGMHHSLASLGVGALLGMICAAVSVMLVLIYALTSGRDFCNEVCPVGTALRFVSSRSLMHIELYPDKCTSCLKCQDVCKASCIDIKTRTIDNARCVRCFNCISVCDDDAIRFTFDHNRVATPLATPSK